MADISNKTVAFLLIGAIAISLIGTFVSLNRLGKMGIPVISGAATSGAGTAQLTIASALSITLSEDDTVDFGTCTPTTGGTWFESNATDKNGTGQGYCDGLGYPDNITVWNDGNEYANVTISASNVDLTGGTLNKSLMFAMMNASKPGCTRAAQRAWKNMTADYNYTVCGNLTFATDLNRIWVYFGVWAPQDSTAGQRTSTLTFTAYQSVAS